ncbi:hypothetical protein [Emcibacter sp. SYSU 3D8]|uniref:hypothetical protein n=1 Tax=Emcibacter sp. SYSU 3D8 TaxID=3133969 RepID=UPI0031FF30A0
MAVLAQEIEILPRLAHLGLSKAALLDVVRAAVGSRRNTTPFHPLSAGGQLSWIEGTAHLRRVFVPQGWEICRRDNIESIFNEAVGIKVIFQNADRAGDPLRDPIATSKKGAGSARAVELGQYDLFPEDKAREDVEITAAPWVLFVYADGDDVRAELSCPIAINDERYDGFHERILLVQKGEWDGPNPLADDGEPPVDYEVTISRKG